MPATVPFQLFAPRNPKVDLIGTFSDWQAISMEKGDDGYFRTQVELEDGSYHYQFRVQPRNFADPWIEINDPYATEIDPMSQRGIVRVKAGQRMIDTYQWQHDDQPLPANRDLIIYEMHLADFCEAARDSSSVSQFERAIAK